MNKIQKVDLLLSLAKKAANMLGESWDTLEQKHRLTYYACAMYRKATGKAPGQEVIDLVRFNVVW
jgi:hypothetical protein